MRKITRLKNLIIALIMFAIAIALFAEPQYGPLVIILLVGLALIAYGLVTLIFYITMASHMVGGKRIFYRSILILDLGVLLLAGYNGSEQLILLYLLGVLAVSGGIDIIRALEFRKEGASWKRRLISGLVCIAMLIVGTILMDNPRTVVYIFCIRLLYLGVTRLISVFKKTAVIYIPE